MSAELQATDWLPDLFAAIDAKDVKGFLGFLAGSFFLLGFYRAQEAIVARFPWLSVGGPKRGPESL